MALQTYTSGQILTAAQMTTLQANDYNWTVSNKTSSYVLAAADKGTRIVMNNAGATTITVNTSLFNAGDTLQITNIGAGTCTVTAGTATVTTSSSLAIPQWGGGTLYFTSASAAIFFLTGGISYGTATGGTSSSITIGGVNYTLLTFTVDGTLTVTKAGLFDYLVIGSGAGSSRPFNGGGGGGAGQLIEGTAYFSANQTVTVGAGGAVNAINTGVSRIGSGIFAMCGGGSVGPSQDLYGASGCGTTGGSLYGRGIAYANGITGYGGGQGSTTAPNYAGGGGGGMGGAGTDASGGTPGSGGAGVSNSFNNVATTYCRGGFGGIASGGVVNAGANTGNGGGNTINNYGAGGSGLIMVRFKV